MAEDKSQQVQAHTADRDGEQTVLTEVERQQLEADHLRIVTEIARVKADAAAALKKDKKSQAAAARLAERILLALAPEQNELQALETRYIKARLAGGETDSEAIRLELRHKTKNQLPAEIRDFVFKDMPEQVDQPESPTDTSAEPTPDPEEERATAMKAIADQHFDRLNQVAFLRTQIELGILTDPAAIEEAQEKIADYNKQLQELQEQYLTAGGITAEGRTAALVQLQQDSKNRIDPSMRERVYRRKEVPKTPPVTESPVAETPVGGNTGGDSRAKAQTTENTPPPKVDEAFRRESFRRPEGETAGKRKGESTDEPEPPKTKTREVDRSAIKDPYQRLDLARNATEDDIKKAFRRLAREYHPDTHPNDAQAAANFKAINEAHEILSDADKRARYDRFGQTNFPAGWKPTDAPPNQPPPPGADRGGAGRQRNWWDDIFNGGFNGFWGEATGSAQSAGSQNRQEQRQQPNPDEVRRQQAEAERLRQRAELIRQFDRTTSVWQMRDILNKLTPLLDGGQFQTAAGETIGALTLKNQLDSLVNRLESVQVDSARGSLRLLPDGVRQRVESEVNLVILALQTISKPDATTSELLTHLTTLAGKNFNFREGGRPAVKSAANVRAAIVEVRSPRVNAKPAEVHQLMSDPRFTDVADIRAKVYYELRRDWVQGVLKVEGPIPAVPLELVGGFAAQELRRGKVEAKPQPETPPPPRTEPPRREQTPPPKAEPNTEKKKTPPPEPKSGEKKTKPVAPEDIPWWDKPLLYDVLIPEGAKLFKKMMGRVRAGLGGPPRRKPETSQAGTQPENQRRPSGKQVENEIEDDEEEGNPPYYEDMSVLTAEIREKAGERVVGQRADGSEYTGNELADELDKLTPRWWNRKRFKRVGGMDIEITDREKIVELQSRNIPDQMIAVVIGILERPTS